MKTKKLLPKPLIAENFSVFGELIEVNEKASHFTINDGYTERYHDLAKVDVNKNGGRALINIFRSTPLSKPLAIKMMERHPLSSQAFIPLGEQPYWVVVAPAGDFDEDKIEVFLAASNQGVNYAAGTWHHYCLALNEVSDFIVIDRGCDDRNGEKAEKKNCDVVNLDGSIIISSN